jgi:Putative phage abortive infection protein
VYAEFYQAHYPALGYYFRFVHNIILFVVDASIVPKGSSKSKLDLGDGQRYLFLLQAQLSNDELALLFYYALSSKSYSLKEEPELFRWPEKYNLLMDLDETSLLRRGHLRFYPQTVFRFLSVDERKEKRAV